MSITYHELTRRLHAWAGKGPKASRRRYLTLALSFVSYCRARGAMDPSQIGRKLAYEWIGEANQRMRHYAARQVWLALDRPPLPPPSAGPQREQAPG